MEVSEVSINQVFLPTRTLEIPFFQRSYVWKEENWAKFYEDIADIAIAINEGEKIDDYFMGSIILKAGNTSQQFDVIDGQQRLSTIVLFMKALFLSLGRNDLFNKNFMQENPFGDSNPILVPNHNDMAVYNQVISAEVLETETIDETSAMANAYAYFAKRIKKSEGGEDSEYNVTPRVLYETIMNHVKLVCIQVAKDENAQRIFETINCTGVKLTTGEMLKNYLYDKTRIDEYNRTWKPIFEGDNFDYWNDSIVLGRIESNHIQNFFYRYMLVKMQEPEIKENLTQTEIKRYRKQDGLFEKFKCLIENNNLPIPLMIEDVTRCASLYKNTFKKDVIDEGLTKYMGIERLVGLMYAQDAWTMTPYILYVLKNQNNQREQQQIFGYMENYLVRRTFCKSKNNNYSDLFSENLIGQRVITYEGFKAYVNDSNARGALLIPSDEELKNAILNEDQKRNAGVLLYMFESKINNEFTNSEFSNGFGDFVVEQVMPEKNNDTWATEGYTTEDRERLTKTIGNFVLLREKFKTADKKADWLQKREAIKKRVADIASSRLYTLDQWSEESIENRNQMIAQKAIELWPL